MFRAVFVRTLKPGVSDEQFVEAWMPTGLTTDAYPCATTISHSTTAERQVISIFEIDTTADRQRDLWIHPAAAPPLVASRTIASPRDLSQR